MLETTQSSLLYEVIILVLINLFCLGQWFTQVILIFAVWQLRNDNCLTILICRATRERTRWPADCFRVWTRSDARVIFKTAPSVVCSFLVECCGVLRIFLRYFHCGKPTCEQVHDDLKYQTTRERTSSTSLWTRCYLIHAFAFISETDWCSCWNSQIKRKIGLGGCSLGVYPMFINVTFHAVSSQGQKTYCVRASRLHSEPLPFFRRSLPVVGKTMWLLPRG